MAKMIAEESPDDTGEVSLPIVSPPTPSPPILPSSTGSPGPATAPRQVPNYSYLRPTASTSPVARNVSVASVATASTTGTAFRGSVNSAKPSFWSVPDSVRSLVGSTAPISEEPSSSSLVHELALQTLRPVNSDIKDTHIWYPAQVDGCASEGGVTAQNSKLLPETRRKPRKLKRRNTGHSSIDSRPRRKVTATTKKQQPKAEKKEVWLQMMVVMRLLHHISARDRVVLVVGLIAAMGSGCSVPMINVVFGQLMDIVLKFYAIDSPSHDTKQQFISSVNDNVLYIVYLAGARFLFSYTSNSVFPITGFRISASIRHRYLHALLHQPISILDSLPLGITTHAMTTTSEYIQTGCGEQLAILVRTSALIISALVIAFVYSWQLALMVCAGLTPIGVIYMVTVSSVKRVMASAQEVNTQARDVASEAFGMVKAVIALGGQRDMEYRFKHWVRESEKRGLRVTKFMSLQQGGLILVISCCNALAFFYGMRLYLTYDILDVGTIAIVLGSIMLVPASIGAFSQPIQAIAMATNHASFIFDLIDSPTPTIPGLIPETDHTDKGITLKNISLAYRSRPDVKVLDDVSFSIPAGKLTAIVGPSGAGKTSIINLLERWYDLDPSRKADLRNGSIEYGGQPLCNFNMHWWRSRIGMVSQDPFLFDDTILANIEYGLVGTKFEFEPAEVKRAMIETACTEAMAIDFIDCLPDGILTRLTGSASQLTAGQRQQIAIARAIVRQPDILILDEATSALSGREEMLVHTALTKACENRTTIMISHRLSAIRNADRVIVLVHGKVVQEGTQEELIQVEGGAYRTLASAQQLDLDNVNGIRRPTTWWRRKSGLVPLMLEGFEFTENKEWEQNMRRGLDLMTSYLSRQPAGTMERPSGLLGISFTLISERRELWPWYFMLFVGAVIAGGATTMHTYVFVEQILSFLSLDTIERNVDFWCLMLLAIAGALCLGYFFLAWATTSLSLRLFQSLRAEYFSNTLKQSPPFFDTRYHSPEALTAAITVDSDHLQRLLTSSAGVALVSISQAAGCLAVSFYFGWKLAIIATGTIVPLIASALFFRIHDDVKTGRSNAEALEKAAQFVDNTILASRTISSLTLEERMLDKYAKFLNDQIDAASGRRWFSVVFLALGESIPFLWIAFVAWFGGQVMVTHEYDVFNFLITFTGVVQQGISGSQRLGFSLNLTHATAAAKRIIARRDDESPIEYPNLTCVTTDNDEEDKLAFNIEFLNVWLKYPSREIPVLTGLNIRINKGQTIAIVGESGSGKSSIMALLERFYVPTQGMITLDGVNIQSRNLKAYRECISMVTQDPCLITGTLRDNIMFGAPQGASEDDMHEAAKQAGIHELAMSLPEGYETSIGTRGTLLVEPQRLRVAIARALVRKPRLLLLDEVTDNLGVDAAIDIQKTLEQARGGRSVVISAHKLDNVRTADMIYVVEDGGVVEFGSHEELMERRNVYYHMSLAQTLD